ncbi:hypothetical protein RUM43_012727 [Polyplax serrata]|uniref:Uncharacterized protein n=1 Tax=Polyplax serrata TaxID=468196 RepID=A0AAN8S6H1_POLSC
MEEKQKSDSDISLGRKSRRNSGGFLQVSSDLLEFVKERNPFKISKLRNNALEKFNRKEMKEAESKQFKLSKQQMSESFQFDEDNRQRWSDVDSNDWSLCLENSRVFHEDLKFVLP